MTIPGLFPREYRLFPLHSLILKAIPYSRSPYIGRGTGMDGNGEPAECRNGRSRQVAGGARP